MVVAPTPPIEQLYNVGYQKYRGLIYKERSRLFHKCVTSFMFITIRCRRDIQNAVAFFCRRLIHQDEYDWGELKMLL